MTYDSTEQREATRLDPDPLTPPGYLEFKQAEAQRARELFAPPPQFVMRWQPILAALVTGFVLGATAIILLYERSGIR